MLVRHQGVLG